MLAEKRELVPESAPRCDLLYSLAGRCSDGVLQALPKHWAESWKIPDATGSGFSLFWPLEFSKRASKKFPDSTTYALLPSFMGCS